MTKTRAYLFFIVIFVVSAGIRMRLAQDKVLHHWDEKFHALVAKHCMDEPLQPTLYKEALLPYQYQNWYNNHIWLHKQPLPLWLMAASMKLFGINEFSLRLPSIVLSLAMLIVFFLFVLKLYTPKIAVLSSFFLGINGLFLELGAGRVATDHYDVLFAVFIFMAIYFAHQHASKNKPSFAIITGIFIGLAVLTKWLPALIVLPVHGLLLLHYAHSKKNIIKTLLLSGTVACSVALPWQCYILSHFPQEAKWEYLHNWLHITTELEGHKNPGTFYYLHKIAVNYSEIIYLALLFFLYRFNKDKEQRYLNSAWIIWVLLPILFFSLAQTKMQGYILFVSPALFIITAQFFEYLTTQLPLQKKRLQKFGAYLLIVAILFLPLRYCFERTKFGLVAPEEDKPRSVYKQLNNKFPEKTVLLNCKWPIECMFYTNYLAYPNKEISENLLQQLREKGYHVYSLNNSGNSAVPY